MDGNLWARVYQTVMTLDHTESARVTYSDRVIVLVLLRAAADNLSVLRACQPGTWVGLKTPADLPSQPTVSRRARTPGIQALLQAAENWLRFHEAVAECEHLLVIDGRPLTINPYSKDPDAHWGHAIQGFGFGYKLHAIWGNAPVPHAWVICPLNVSEPVVARQVLVPALPIGQGRRRPHLLGDCSYDSNPLFAASAARRYRLTAPPKKKDRGLGHRFHHPDRLSARARLQTPAGKRLYKRRGLIERQFGNMAMRPEGLAELPAHVRRLHRVVCFVHCKLILNGFRILDNHNAFGPLPHE